ncbi:MAG: hypothetical protein GXP62_04080 [Oligoflexia bacterium]|nr:hypothetical protein [Oligoflexia bacterium]
MSRSPSSPLSAATLAGLTFVGVLSSGCLGGHKATRQEGHYDVGSPGEAWIIVRPGGADHAWVHDGISASIYTDSNCATRFDDRPLDRLADSVVFGIATSKPLRDETRTIDGRDALIRVVDGNLDGVVVRIAATVLKKDDCVYDLLYIAPPATFDTGWDSYEAVLAGFATRGG